MPLLALCFALAALVLAASVGLIMLRSYIQSALIPVPAAVAHGAAAAIGVALVCWFLYTAYRGGVPYGPWPFVVLGVLVAAALGGAILVAQHARRRPLSIPLMGIHASAGLLGILLLIVLLVMRVQSSGPVPPNPAPDVLP